MNRLDDEVLDKLLGTPPSFYSRSDWYVSENHKIRVYLRLQHTVSGDPVLVVANVISKEPFKGNYSNFLEWLEEKCKVLIVENVSDKDQHSIYLKRGFRKVEQNGTTSFYKVVPVR